MNEIKPQFLHIYLFDKEDKALGDLLVQLPFHADDHVILYSNSDFTGITRATSTLTAGVDIAVKNKVRP